MLIPHTQLSAETLDTLLSEYATRIGTDDEEVTTLDQRKTELLSLLQREEAFITYNHEYQQPCLVPRHEVPDSALKEFKKLQESLHADEAAAKEEAKDAETFACLAKHMRDTGVFPFPLGRTFMQAGVDVLLQKGKFTLEQLQDLLRRHSMGDFGRLSAGDQLQNLRDIEKKGHVLSLYELAGIALYVETAPGHDQTMVMERSAR